MQIDFYFSRKFIGQFLLMFSIIGLFATTIDLIEQARRVADLGFGEIILKVGWNLPINLGVFMPLVIMLSSIGFAIGLTRSSEMVIARASGRSLIRNFAFPILSAFVIGLLILAVLNPLAARSHQHLHSLNDSRSSKEQSVLSVSKNGVWLRQNEEEGYSIISAKTVDNMTLTFHKVTWIRYDISNKIIEQIQADKAQLSPEKQWTLFQTRYWTFSESPLNLEAKFAQQRVFTSYISTNDLWEDLTAPELISIWRLPRFIQTLQTVGFSTHKHIAYFYHQISLPIFYVALMVLGSALTLLHFRSNRQSLQVLTAIIIGFGLYYVRDLAYILAENNQLSPLWAVGAPTGAALMFAMGILVGRDGA